MEAELLVAGGHICRRGAYAYGVEAELLVVGDVGGEAADLVKHCNLRHELDEAHRVGLVAHPPVPPRK